MTFLTKTDARTWLAGIHTRISRGEWEPPADVAKRRRANAVADEARSVGFTTYAKRWVEMIRTEPNHAGKRRVAGTVRSYTSKVDELPDPGVRRHPVREIDIDRIRVMTTRLNQIPSPLNPKFNGITRPVLTVLIMILRQAARDEIISAASRVSVPKPLTDKRTRADDGTGTGAED
ncbi:hypothetical protein [Arthrobacter woluwensis]|uniref:hypothetical protein n=1 Tax=Arthrobacter woluwensis TaxID=156980 RepID=UPI001AAEB40B|nr:hypothetical protein [Arthrobacter woluwensis]QTF71290.1 hypothetical protein G8758_04165 [Arthrobacter woluwensis]